MSGVQTLCIEISKNLSLLSRFLNLIIIIEDEKHYFTSLTLEEKELFLDKTGLFKPIDLV
jgi:hypothetical protein